MVFFYSSRGAAVLFGRLTKFHYQLHYPLHKECPNWEKGWYIYPSARFLFFFFIKGGYRRADDGSSGDDGGGGDVMTGVVVVAAVGGSSGEAMAV